MITLQQKNTSSFPKDNILSNGICVGDISHTSNNDLLPCYTVDIVNDASFKRKFYSYTCAVQYALAIDLNSAD